MPVSGRVWVILLSHVLLGLLANTLPGLLSKRLSVFWLSSPSLQGCGSGDVVSVSLAWTTTAGPGGLESYLPATCWCLGYPRFSHMA